MGLNYEKIKEVEYKISINFKKQPYLEKSIEEIFKDYKWGDFVIGYNEVGIEFNTNKYQFWLTTHPYYYNAYNIRIIPNLITKTTEIQNIMIILKK